MNPVVRALLLTVIVSAAALCVVLFLGGSKTGLLKPAKGFLRHYWGEDDEGVIARSSQAYQRRLGDTYYEDLRGLRKSLLGELVGVEEVLRDEVDTLGKGHVVLRVEFEKATATASFELVDVEGSWRVGTFELEVPRPRDSTDMRVNPREFTKRLLWRWAESEELWRHAWTRLSDELRAKMPIETFGKLRAAWLETTGPYRDIELKSYNEIDDTTVEATYVLTLEKGRRKGRVKMVWRDVYWTVVVFDVEGFGQ